GAPSDFVLRADAGAHRVGEALPPDGFVDVPLEGQHHSSTPAAADFDRALAGAAGAALAGIRFDGGGHATLILDSQNLPGSLTVHATGATVITNDVAVAGQLVVQAAEITVSGALPGGAVALAGGA